ncbi:geranylgeranyl diphosphate synthase type I [Leucobacter komagatae]|uniref:Geranylgeranyl diphosphate synthase type I n=1 Tax=Leucobacter komagatae TaxID=55969 RepID=A0A542Y2F5_9MICO|nr:polyprenyl synthetase family protein [Leucobacter komagatae]TQL42251.1 geranylgeranyl diphosphate synthase type I [Leucobacter komagatae]
MDETTRLAGLIQERLNDIIEGHRAELEPLGPDAGPLLDEATSFLTGGKRFRALFAVHGYRAVRPLDIAGPITDEFAAVLDAACALELFHAAALIHDDVIDRSDTRRGRPAVHRSFAKLHGEHGHRGAPEHFGISSAILLGDLLQSWSDELMNRACDGAPEASFARAARAHFNRMRSEVAVGQYLDVLEEQRSTFADHAEQLDRSTRVLVYKSAKYSVEAPLLIGGALAGASAEQEAALAGFGLPVGVAFQLRDDLLGVFGDEEVTGKPSGDDLVEGKRTVLVTLAREALPVTQRRIFDDLLGTDLDGEQVYMLQRTIRDSGAEQQVEQMISRNIERAHRALGDAGLDDAAAARLSALAGRAASRDS